jgi:hypothetical protein
VELVDLARTDREYRSLEAVRYAVGAQLYGRPAASAPATGRTPGSTPSSASSRGSSTGSPVWPARVYECRPTLV